MSKICFISQEFYPFSQGGIGAQFYAQIRIAKEAGHDIVFLTRKPSNFDEKRFSDHYQGVEVVMIDNPPASSEHFWLDYSLLVKKHFDDLDPESIDIVIGAEFCGEQFHILLDRLVSGTRANYAFATYLYGASREMLKHNGIEKLNDEQQLVCQLEDSSVLMSDFTISASETLLKDISERLRIDKNKARIIPSIPHQSIFDFKREPSNLVVEPKKILFIGKLEMRQGADFALEAFLNLRKEQPDLNIKLIMLANDSYWNGYNASFIEHWRDKMTDEELRHVDFRGLIPRDEFQKEIREASVCVFPSRWEGAGLHALDVLAAGTPIIVSDSTALKEMVGDDYDALFNPEEGTEQLTKLLTRILTEEDYRQNLSQTIWNSGKHHQVENASLFLEMIDYVGNHENRVMPTQKQRQDTLRQLREIREWLLKHQNITNFVTQETAEWIEVAMGSLTKERIDLKDIPETRTPQKTLFCLIGQLGNGGTERQLFQFLKNLNRNLYDPTVVVSDVSRGIWKDRISKDLNIPIEFLGSMPGPLKLLKFLLLRLKQKPDIIYSWSFFTNAFHLVAGKTPFIGSLRQQLSVEKGNLSSWRVKMCEKCKKLVVNSSFIRDELIEDGVPKENIQVVYNIFEPLEQRNEGGIVRREYGIAEDAVVVIGAGRHSPTKDFPFFLDVFEKASAKLPKLHGMLIGSGGEALRDEIASRGLTEKITITGEVTDARRVFPCGDIFFLSSKNEGLPNVLLEALDAGCAPLATNVGGVSDILGDAEKSKTGFIIENGDIETAVDRIEQMTTNPNLRQTITANARKRLELFSSRSGMKGYSKVLETK